MTTDVPAGKSCEQSQQNQPSEQPESHETRVSAFFPYLLVLVAMLGPLAMTIFVPALPVIASDLQVTASVAQLVLSVSLLATAMASLVYGSMADRHGRRPAMLIGFGASIVGSMVAANSARIEWVIIGRAIQAIGVGAGYVLVRVIVHDLYRGQRAVVMLGFITAAMAIAPIAGPVAGGLLIDTLGWRWTFGAIGAVSAALWIVSLIALAETRPPIKVSSADDGIAGWPQLVRQPAYLRYAIPGVSIFVVFYAFVSGAPYLMIRDNAMPALDYGFYYATAPFGFMLGALLTGRLGGRLTIHRLCLFGMLAMAAFALVCLSWLTADPGNPWALFAPMFGISGAAGFALPAAQSGLVRASAGLPGAGSGIFTFFQLACSAAVAQGVGYAMQHNAGSLGVTVPLVLGSLVGLIGYALFTRRDKPARPATT